MGSLRNLVTTADIKSHANSQALLVLLFNTAFWHCSLKNFANIKFFLVSSFFLFSIFCSNSFNPWSTNFLIFFPVSFSLPLCPSLQPYLSSLVSPLLRIIPQDIWGLVFPSSDIAKWRYRSLFLSPWHQPSSSKPFFFFNYLGTYFKTGTTMAVWYPAFGACGDWSSSWNRWSCCTLCPLFTDIFLLCLTVKNIP